jgi:predicted negative regulator of RcsB-dependent stress response
MSNRLTSRELIAVARCLTHFQSDITDYELENYASLDNTQRAEIEQTLSLLAVSAGSLYAFVVQLEFAQIQPEIQKMQEATEGLKRFLHTTQKIQQILDVVSAVAALADAIMNTDVESITSGIDNIIGMTGID